MQTRNGSLPTLPTAAPCLGADSKKWKKSCGEDAQNDTTHPLQSSSIDIPIFVSALEDGTLTRPGLRRKLPVAPPDDAPSAVPTFPKDPRRTHLDATSAFDMWATTSAASGSDTGSDNGVPRNTKEVYVHEVMPTDSLASVALRYGIKVAALRKANKLWPSDSIHLRKVLYIPVDWRRAEASIVEVDETVAGPSSPQLSGRSFIDSQSNPGSVAKRHVSLSELSFFPPSTSPSITPIPNDPLWPNLSGSKETHTVFGVSGNGIERLDRMSTDSLALYNPRVSLSDDGVGTYPSVQSDVEVEMDIAKDTWRRSRINAWRRSASPETSIKSKGRAPVVGGGTSITNRQPTETPQMVIPR